VRQSEGPIAFWSHTDAADDFPGPEVRELLIIGCALKVTDIEVIRQEWKSFIYPTLVVSPGIAYSAGGTSGYASKPYWIGPLVPGADQVIRIFQVGQRRSNYAVRLHDKSSAERISHVGLVLLQIRG
jgi:hypothetical protein